MNHDRLLSLFGLARRAGKLSWGFDSVLEAIAKKQAHAVFLANDISSKTAKEVRFAAGKHNLPVTQIRADMDKIQKAIGKTAGVVSLNDRGFAARALQICTELYGEETGL